MTTTLVLGGARSGKSAYAQRAAEATGQPGLTLIATATALDAEMADRIARHQRDRDARWTALEVPLALPEALTPFEPGQAVVVDCLTLWLTNLMLGEEDIEAATLALLDAVLTTRADLWLVSNEVGWGVVPETALGRRFRDEAGRLHQRLAAVCDAAVLIVAGLPLVLKAPG